MDCRPSSVTPATEKAALISQAVARRDWDRADSLAAELPFCDPPQNEKDAKEYLRELHQAIVLARAARSCAADSLRRLQAASSFGAGLSTGG
jgi:hypothetical protein